MSKKPRKKKPKTSTPKKKPGTGAPAQKHAWDRGRARQSPTPSWTPGTSGHTVGKGSR